MSYDDWKTTNPDDEFLGPRYCIPCTIGHHGDCYGECECDEDSHEERHANA